MFIAVFEITNINKGWNGIPITLPFKILGEIVCIVHKTTQEDALAIVSATIGGNATEIIILSSADLNNFIVVQCVGFIE